MSQPGTPVDPYRAYNFKFEINGTLQAHFIRVEGLGFKMERILYRAGGEHTTIRSLPGRVQYNPVTLRYGVTTSTDMLAWILKAVDGHVQRQNVSIAMLDDAGTREVRRWNLFDAWPCEWTGAPLDALGNEVAIESLTLSFDRLELDDATAPME